MNRLDAGQNLDVMRLLNQLRESVGSAPVSWDGEETPIGRITREFLTNNWRQARDGLLARTSRIRLCPQAPDEAPRVFRYAVELPYKRKSWETSEIELAPGPIEGQVIYRADLLSPRDDHAPAVAVTVDDRELYHPNFSRIHGLLCLGMLPAGPFPLERLLEHLYQILSYQNVSVTDPFDPEAACYFATDPAAMSGLERNDPLY